jgi:AraC-like DNA-binding protein
MFPSENSNLSLECYLDTAGTGKEGGTVITSFDTSRNYIGIDYTIGSRNIYPYAGFQWIVKNGKPWIDLRGFDHLTFSIDSGTTEDVIILILQYFTDGFSTLDDRMTWRYTIKELPLTKGKTTYSIPIKEFITPLWWFNQYKKTEKEFGPVDYSKLGMLSVEDGSDALGIPKSIRLRSLEFENKQGFLIAELIFSILIFYYILLISFIQIKKMVNKKNSPVVIHYQKLTIENDQKSLEMKVFEYLGNNFSNPDLSLFFISSTIGISGNKISMVIKNRYNLTFRQYLNRIRIAEAKRLLQETDLQISQIAYKVGYSNLTHFCRTFKDETQTSPNLYRHELVDTDSSMVQQK